MAKGNEGPALVLPPLIPRRNHPLHKVDAKRSPFFAMHTRLAKTITSSTPSMRRVAPTTPKGRSSGDSLAEWLSCRALSLRIPSQEDLLGFITNEHTTPTFGNISLSEGPYNK